MGDNPHATAFPRVIPLDPALGLEAAWVVVELPEALAEFPITVELPRMCPRSGNPGPGSTLSLRPLVPEHMVPEVGAVAGEAAAAARQLVGGYQGVRTMEGAIAFIAQAVSGLLGCDVEYRADLQIITPPPARVRCQFILHGRVRAGASAEQAPVQVTSE